MCATFLLENLKGRDHSEDLDIDGKILKWMLGKWCEKVWAGYIWLSITTSGGILWTR